MTEQHITDDANGTTDLRTLVDAGEHALVSYDVAGGMSDARVRGTVKTADGDKIEIDPDSPRMKTATVDLGTGGVEVLKDGGSGTGMITLRGQLNGIESTEDETEAER